MIVHARNMFINYIINNYRQVNPITVSYTLESIIIILTKIGNYISIHSLSSFKNEAFSIIIFSSIGRKGAPFMTQALMNDSFSYFSCYTLLSDLSFNMCGIYQYLDQRSLASPRSSWTPHPSIAVGLFINAFH